MCPHRALALEGVLIIGIDAWSVGISEGAIVADTGYGRVATAEFTTDRGLSPGPYVPSALF